MAKRKKVITHLVCTEDKSKNYTQVVSKTRQVGSLTLPKFCAKCRKHTAHKEIK
jgi:large subunit ribosomal protein L33